MQCLVDAGRRLDRRIQSSRWIARRKRDDWMAYVDRVFRLRIFGRRLGGKRRAESHGGPLDERVSRNGPRPTGQDATPSMARASLG